MKKNIAICIRGQIRTWDKCKSNIFKTFEHLERTANVYWFFISWELHDYPKYFFRTDTAGAVKFKQVSKTSTIVDHAIVNHDFIGRRVMTRLLPFDPSLTQSASFAKLCSNASNIILDFSIQHGVDFDAVVMIRPDVIFMHSHQDNARILCNNILLSDRYWVLNFNQNLLEKDGRAIRNYMHCPIDNKFPSKAADSWAFNDLIYYGAPGMIDLIHDAYHKIKYQYLSDSEIYPHAAFGNQCARFGISVHATMVNAIIIRDISYPGFNFTTDFNAETIDINNEYFKFTTSAWYEKEEDND